MLLPDALRLLTKQATHIRTLADGAPLMRFPPSARYSHDNSGSFKGDGKSLEARCSKVDTDADLALFFTVDDLKKLLAEL